MSVLLILLLILILSVRASFQAGQDAAARRAASASPNDSAAASPTPSPAPPGGVLTHTLQAQGAALLRGDQAGWLGPLDPGNTALLTRFRDLFSSLRAMKVAAWHPVTYYDLGAAVGQHDNVKTRFGYCFTPAPCPAPTFFGDQVQALDATVSYRVDTHHHVVITAINPTDAPHHPLEDAGMLTAAVGKRVTLAGPPELASQLRTLLPRADRAAYTADHYARWHNRPTRYVIYLANSREWATWFNGEGKKDEKIAGYAVRTSTNSSDVVIDQSLPNGELDQVMRHELGHVATLIGSTETGEIWVSEGVAEYVAYNGFPATAADGRIEQTRRYLRTGAWSGQLNAGWNLTDNGGVGAYGIAYLTMRHLADKYGDEALMNFVGLNLRQGVSVPDAARQAFNTSWSSPREWCFAVEA